MYHSVLVPLDGSDFGEHALAAAHGIARRAGRESPMMLHLVQVHMPIVTAYVEGFPVVDEELDRAAREAETSYLATVRDGFGGDGNITIVTHVIDGNVAEALAAYATEHHVDLIIMTTHGRGGLARAWLGSVADELVRRGATPTLLLRPHADRLPDVTEQVFQRIVVPLDGSRASEAILSAVVPLAQLMHAQITLMRAIEPVSEPTFNLHHYSARLTERVLDDMCADAETYLKQVATRLSVEGVPVATEVIVAAWPALAILDQARLRAADLIAMTTRGRGGLARLLLGSTADKVLRAADVPVLLLRPHATAAATEPEEHRNEVLVA